jgi:hypothetical protein
MLESEPLPCCQAASLIERSSNRHIRTAVRAAIPAWRLFPENSTPLGYGVSPANWMVSSPRSIWAEVHTSAFVVGEASSSMR